MLIYPSWKIIRDFRVKHMVVDICKYIYPVLIFHRLFVYRILDDDSDIFM